MVGDMCSAADSSPLLFKLSGADSSPPSSASASAESNFRELDDVFLQTQTRIWLGEVLQTRLDEEVNISDLLADGELLFQASRVVWKLLLKNRMELRHTKAYKYEPFASRKSSGKYMPYSNVDSFLKVCKILGLTGIDLFTPSDVVEKRNTRKVCMCIRSLTKKARSKHLNVPDFDIVTYTVAMPTDMVGWIRRSLELQGSFSSSASYYSSKISGPKPVQDNIVSASPRSYDSYSEESDEAESNHRILQSDDAECQMNSILTYIPGISSQDHELAQNLEFDIQNKKEIENTQLQSDSLCESVGSFCSEHDFQLNSIASPTCINSHIYSSARAYTERVGQGCENGATDLNHVDLDLRNGASVTKTPTSSINNNSNACYCRMYCGESTLFDTEDSNAFRSNSSHGSNAARIDYENGFTRLSYDDLEVSSTADNDMHSLSEAMMNLDIDDQCDAKDDFGTACSSYLASHETDLILSAKTTKVDTSQDLVNNETLVQNVSSHLEKPSLDTEVADNGLSAILLDFNDQLGTKDDFGAVCSFNSPSGETNHFSAKTVGVDASQDLVNYETMLQNVVSDSEKPSLDMAAAYNGLSTNLFIPCSDLQSHTSGYADSVSFENGVYVSQINPSVVHDETKLSQVDSNKYWDSDMCEGLPLVWDTSQCQLDKWEIEERTGNDDLETPNSPSQGGLQEEKLREDIIQLMDVKSIVPDNGKDSFNTVTSESVATVYFDNIIDTTYKDSDASSKNSVVEGIEKDLTFSSTCDDGDFQCQDSTTQGQHMPNEGENRHQESRDHIDIIYCTENADKDEREHAKVGMSTVEVANADVDLVDANVGSQNSKPRRRPLLKSVVKGTALISVLLIVFHLRRSGQENSRPLAYRRSGKVNTGQSTATESSHVQKTSTAKLSMKEEQKNGIYPAEKLRF